MTTPTQYVGDVDIILAVAGPGEETGRFLTSCLRNLPKSQPTPDFDSAIAHPFHLRKASRQIDRNSRILAAMRHNDGDIDNYLPILPDDSVDVSGEMGEKVFQWRTENWGTIDNAFGAKQYRYVDKGPDKPHLMLVSFKVTNTVPVGVLRSWSLLYMELNFVLRYFVDPIDISGRIVAKAGTVQPTNVQYPK